MKMETETGHDTRISYVPPDELHHWVEVFKPWIKDALDQSPWMGDNVEEVVQALYLGEAQLIYVEHDGQLAAVSVLQRIERRGDPCLHVYTLTGYGAEHWFEAYRLFIETVARESHIPVVSLTGRKGWQRMLAKNGYQVESVTLEKVVTA